MPIQLNDQQEHWLKFKEKFKLLDDDEWRQKGKEIYRWAAISKRYKLIQEQWQAMFDQQHGCCAICGARQDELSHPLEIDQDRVTGKIRGLLCRRCNSRIVLLGEDIERLEKAIRHLEY